MQTAQRLYQPWTPADHAVLVRHVLPGCPEPIPLVTVAAMLGRTAKAIERHCQNLRQHAARTPKTWHPGCVHPRENRICVMFTKRGNPWMAVKTIRNAALSKNVALEDTRIHLDALVARGILEWQDVPTVREIPGVKYHFDNAKELARWLEEMAERDRVEAERVKVEGEECERRWKLKEVSS